MSASRPSIPRCNPSLRIELTRSGGYAGLTTKLGELDTAELPESEARELEDLVSKANVPALAAASPIRGGGADRFQYELTIEGPDGRHELAISEDRIPDELRPLIERLKERSG
jgi:Emfourin